MGTHARRPTTVRFPDVKSSGIDFTGKTVILYLPQRQPRLRDLPGVWRSMGIDCRFLVGGLEKWLVESRPLTGLNARTLAELRAMPAHRNQSALLDTDAGARSRWRRRSAVFVDTRYPGEFAARSSARRHQPADLRRCRRREFRTEHRRNCRSSRSSCLATIAAAASSAKCSALSFERAGHDFRGRYTLPWEFFTERAAPVHQGVARGEQQGLVPEGRRGAGRRAVADRRRTSA